MSAPEFEHPSSVAVSSALEPGCPFSVAELSVLESEHPSSVAVFSVPELVPAKYNREKGHNILAQV